MTSGLNGHSNSHAFPPDFLWGTATSAYQIEGATREDGRGLSIWDSFAATPGKTYQGETGDIAINHYHTMEQDVTLMAEMGLNAYLFSISWPRVLPSGVGTANARGLDFYDRLVDTLLARSITPLIKLYHWDLPQALHERGGWLERDTAYAFADYAEVVAERLGDRVDWWLTHNEPWCSSYLGYGIGIHAPGICDLQSAVVAAHHVLLSHGLALPRLRAHTRPSAHLGIAIDCYPVYPGDERPETRTSVERADIFRNRWFLDPVFRGSYPDGLFADMAVYPPHMEENDLSIISTPIDFLGVNYYSRMLVRSPEQTNAPTLLPVETNERQPPYVEVTPIPGASYTEMGWEIYPDGLATTLQRLHHDYAPADLLITENGAAFQDHWDGNNHVNDPRRVQYLREHIQAVEQALQQGVPMRGYFAWSLMDNYEWTEGYSKRFGMVYVDYPTQRRIIKDSGHWYASFIASQQQR